MQCEVWRNQWEVRSVKCGVWSVKCEVSVWSVKSAVWSVKCEVWSVKEAVWSVECEVWSLECEECSVKCGVWSVKTLLRLSLKKSNGCRGKDTVGTGCLWTIGRLCLGNFRRRLARVYVRCTVCLHGWLARRRCTWQWQVQVDSTDKSTNANKIDCHRFLHQTKFLEWMCLWWVEGDHCYVHVRLILPWCSMLGYKWSFIFHVHQNVGKHGFALCILRKSYLLHAFPWSLLVCDAIKIWPHMFVIHLWLLWFMPTILIHIGIIGESWDKT